jgi:hypothetical protein
MESSGEINTLRDELIVLRAENALLRQAVEQLKAKLTDLIVQAHRSEMATDAPTASDLKGKKAIYWG